MIMIISVLLVFLVGTSAKPSRRFQATEQTCGYESCPIVKEGMINVHIVPHTHDDVGWLKTVDQYYYGSKTFIQKAGVQYILDSVTDALRKNKDRRFIYVETAFFWKWWMNQPDDIKHQFKQYVDSGQLEFIGGAWSMNDEATTHYQSIIDQFTWGLRKLNETFGECGRPKIGWQIDPFGHSREMASIFAQLGFDGLLLGRIDYQDKSHRFSTKTPEVVWKASPNLGANANIFTGVMYNTYSPPPGFCFDILCADEPIIDDKHSPDYNVDRRIDEFLEYAKNVTEFYTTNNVIITMGGDFTYMDAETWFKNMDKIISYANQRQANGSKYNLIYSTPSCYVEAVYSEAYSKGQKWKTKSDDFFPYASDPHSYWTGYFTSKPTIKRFERLGNNYLQVCKQLNSLTELGPEGTGDLDVLREVMGVMQHHDAITGTEKEHVAHDYVRMLTLGFQECDIVSSAALNKLMRKQAPNSENIPFSSCLLSNISSCPITESSKTFVVTVYNPLSRAVTQFVRFSVLGQAYIVKDPDGNQVESQLIPIADPVISIPGRKSEATVDLIFKAIDIPPLGFKSYYVQRIPGNDILEPLSSHNHEYTGIKLQIDRETGLLASVTMNNVTVPISQEFFYYEGYVGNNEVFSNRSSGAYIFRPYRNEAVSASAKAKFKVYRGNLVTEVHQIFNEWISQIIRLYSGENFVEFEWLVGPLPSKEPRGVEVISRFMTNLKTDSTFYTDSNGREVIKRVRNYRPTWDLEIQEPVAANYYPVTSKLLIRDFAGALEVAVLTDRAQGGSSLKDGEMELMVHRNSIHDDAFGVGEALNETAFGEGLVVRGTHYLILGDISPGKNGHSVAASERELAQRKILQSWSFLSPTMGLTFDEYKNKFLMAYSGLQRNLPKNVQILTLERWIGKSLLLRLEHVFEKNEDPQLSQPAVVNLQGLFTPFKIKSIKETTLGGNQWISDNYRLPFETDDDQLHRSQRYTVIQAFEYGEMVVKLNPMQICTFIVDVSF